MVLLYEYYVMNVWWVYGECVVVMLVVCECVIVCLSRDFCCIIVSIVWLWLVWLYGVRMVVLVRECVGSIAVLCDGEYASSMLCMSVVYE